MKWLSMNLPTKFHRPFVQVEIRCVSVDITDEKFSNSSHIIISLTVIQFMCCSFDAFSIFEIFFFFDSLMANFLNRISGTIDYFFDIFPIFYQASLLKIFSASPASFQFHAAFSQFSTQGWVLIRREIFQILHGCQTVFYFFFSLANFGSSYGGENLALCI